MNQRHIFAAHGPVLGFVFLLILGIASARAQFISEQNGVGDLANLNINGDGGSNNDEFIEFVNSSGGILSLNNYVFGDAGGNTLPISQGTYDFGFGASTGISLAVGQALVIMEDGSAPSATNKLSRNIGGSLAYYKANSFITGSRTIPDGSGSTVSLSAQGAGDIGLNQTGEVAYATNGTTSAGTVFTGPSLTTGSATVHRAGNVAGGAATAHPALNGANASPGVKSDGRSWVTPTQSVAVVSGGLSGNLSGSGNTWSYNFGDVNQGDAVTLTLSLGNSAGLGGVLHAVTGATLATPLKLSLAAGGGQTLKLLGGETTANYGALGTINGFNYSDGATATNLAFTLDSAALGAIGGSYGILVKDGFLVTGAGPSLDSGTLTISFTGVVVPEPSTGMALLGGLGMLIILRRRNRAHLQQA